MAKKKDENPFTPPPATEIKPAELVAENIPPAAEIVAANNPPAEPEIKSDPQPEKTPEPEKQQPVETAPAAPEIPVVTTVTAEQLVSENIPVASLPPVPGQPRRGRGRPSIPHPECKKCGRKHKVGVCPTENGVSQINITDGAQPSDGEAPDTSEAIEEKPTVNHRQLAEMAFDLTTNSAAAFIGPEWRPSDPTEREGVLIPLEMYFKTQKMDDIPPGAILCFALATYAAPRLRAPATASKIKLGWAWIKAKWFGRKKTFVPKVVKGGNPFSESSHAE